MVDEINPELRLYISLQLHDSTETQTIIEFKAKKRVIISDYSLVDDSLEISNNRLEPKDIIDTHHLMTLIMNE